MQSPLGEGLQYAGMPTTSSINSNNTNININNSFLFPVGQISSSSNPPPNNNNNNTFSFVQDAVSPQGYVHHQHHIMASALAQHQQQQHFHSPVQDPPHPVWHHAHHRHLFQSVPTALPQAPQQSHVITPQANPAQDPYSDLGSVLMMRMSNSQSPQLPNTHTLAHPQVDMRSPPQLPLPSSTVFNNNSSNNITNTDSINIKNNINNSSNINTNTNNNNSNGLGEDGDEEGERAGAACSRWPRDETQALLRIRSKLDSNFRDSAFKGPIWEEVSRKLGEEGFYRSAKKCKEKFENVYKYYKRTREGRAGRQDGKNYRFFDELEAFYSANHSQTSGTASGNSRPGSANYNGVLVKQVELAELAPSQQPEISGSAGLLSDTSDYNKDQEEEEEEEELDEEDQEEEETQLEYSNPVISRKRKKGRMLSSSDTCPSSSNNKKFLESLVKQVMEQQEALYKKFMDALEKRDEERMAREEAYRQQEMTRFNHEYELRVKQHALAASRDAALVNFLQKVTGQTLHLDNPPAPTCTTDKINAETEAFSDEQEQEQEQAQQWNNGLVRFRAAMDDPDQDHCSENNRQTPEEETAQANPIPSSNPDTVQTQVSVVSASASLEQEVCHRMRIGKRCSPGDHHQMVFDYSNTPFNPEGLTVKEIMELQQLQQHQKLREEFDRIEQDQVIKDELEQQMEIMRRKQQGNQQQQQKQQQQHPLMNASRDNNSSSLLTLVQKFAVPSDFSTIMAPSSSD